MVPTHTASRWRSRSLRRRMIILRRTARDHRLGLRHQAQGTDQVGEAPAFDQPANDKMRGRSDVCHGRL
jgi:hypothetical protein